MKYHDLVGSAFFSIYRNKFRTFLYTLGITVAVGAVIAATIIGEGNRQQIIDRLEALANPDLLWIASAGEKFFMYMAAIPFAGRAAEVKFKKRPYLDMDLVRTIQKEAVAVKYAGPYVWYEAAIKYADRFASFVIIGTVPGYQDVHRLTLARGRLLNDEDISSRAAVCLIEQSAIAENLLGSPLPVGEYLLIAGRRFKMVGFFEQTFVKIGQKTKGYMLVPLSTLQQMIGRRYVDVIDLRSTSYKTTALAGRQLENILARRYGYPSGFNVSHGAKHVEMVDRTNNSILGVIVGIATISLIVGTVGIANLMIATVYERRREIGILKSLGSRRQEILFLFLLEAIFLSLVGGMVGIVGGVAVGWWLTRFIGLPFILPLWVVGFSFLASVAVGLAAGYYPARQAARFDPAVILQQSK